MKNQIIRGKLSQSRKNGNVRDLYLKKRKKERNECETKIKCKLKMKTHKNSKHIGNYSTHIYYKNRANSVYFFLCTY